MEDACKKPESSRGPWRVNGDSSTLARIFSLTCRTPSAAKGKLDFPLRTLSKVINVRAEIARKKTAPETGRCRINL